MNEETDGAWRRWSLGLVIAAGTGIAAICLGLAVSPRACALDDCQPIIDSAWGSLGGVPVAVYGLLCWALLALAVGAWWRRAAALALVLGSVWFSLIQGLVLEGFCPWCGAHAACALLLVPLWRQIGKGRPSPRRGWSLLAQLVIVGLALGLVGLAVQPAAQPLVRAERLAQDGTAMPVFSSRTQSDALLVLSFDCEHCGNLIDEALIRLDGQRPTPAVLWHVRKTDEQVATAFFIDLLAADEPATVMRRRWRQRRQQKQAVAAEAAAAVQGLLASHRRRIRELGITRAPTLLRGEQRIDRVLPGHLTGER